MISITELNKLYAESFPKREKEMMDFVPKQMEEVESRLRSAAASGINHAMINLDAVNKYTREELEKLGLSVTPSSYQTVGGDGGSCWVVQFPTGEKKSEDVWTFPESNSDVFKSGDVVKSRLVDYPNKMCVGVVRGAIVNCDWFEGEVLHREGFLASELIIAPNDERSVATGAQ